MPKALDRRIAQAHHRVFEQTLRLARALDVQTVITFSGCPGGGPSEKQPNWIVAPWPPEFSAMLAWQWKERVTPYWKSAARLAREHGRRIAIEMHPNFVVYNPETMDRLRAIAPKVIGCNFDPSHMFWQGVDPVVAIRHLGDAIYHVHAKDCRLEPELIAQSGVLDAKSYTRESSARGSSARSATGTARRSGRRWSARWAWSATTTSSASRTKTA